MTKLTTQFGNDIDSFFSFAEKMLNQPESKWAKNWSSKPETKWASSVRPTMDVSEDAQYYYIDMEVPGLDPENFNITLSGRTLQIEGEKTNESNTDERNYHRIERNYGSFTRQIHLPDAASSNDVEATYKHGILRISIPKEEEAQTKQIDVNIKEN